MEMKSCTALYHETIENVQIISLGPYGGPFRQSFKKSFVKGIILTS